MKLEHLVRAACATPWAIWPEKLEEIAAILELRMRGEVLEHVEVAPAPEQRQQGQIAVIPLFGVLAPRMNLMTAASGGTSLDRFMASFRAAVRDPQVSAIVIDVDSPGGSVHGMDEAASEIRAARAEKPIVAQANHLMASAAYNLGSAASEIVVTPSGQVGSIGVLAMHLDESQANEMAGIRPTIISAGKYKAELAPELPLSEEAREAAQGMVDHYYDEFVHSVAASRGVSPDAVRNGYGQGRVLHARDALRVGMVDRVATLDQTLARLGTAQGRSAVMRRGTASAGYISVTSVGNTDEKYSEIIPGTATVVVDPQRKVVTVGTVTDPATLTALGLDLIAGPIAPHTTPKADEDEPWDGPGEVAKAEGEAQLRRMHAWMDDEGDPDAKSSYKLPHHRADGVVVWRGVAAAGAAIQGSRGGVSIPSEDEPGVKRHLAGHYRQFDKTPPWEEERAPENGAEAERELALLDFA